MRERGVVPGCWTCVSSSQAAGGSGIPSSHPPGLLLSSDLVRVLQTSSHLIRFRQIASDFVRFCRVSSQFVRAPRSFFLFWFLITPLVRTTPSMRQNRTFLSFLSFFSTSVFFAIHPPSPQSP
eukprot:1628517-Rhodomonas_salina.1